MCTHFIPDYRSSTCRGYFICLHQYWWSVAWQQVRIYNNPQVSCTQTAHLSLFSTSYL